MSDHGEQAGPDLWDELPGRRVIYGMSGQGEQTGSDEADELRKWCRVIPVTRAW